MVELLSPLQAMIENAVTNHVGFRSPEELEDGLRGFKSAFSHKLSGEYDALTAQACLYLMDIATDCHSGKPVEMSRIYENRYFLGWARERSGGRYTKDPIVLDGEEGMDYLIKWAEFCEGLEAMSRCQGAV